MKLVDFITNITCDITGGDVYHPAVSRLRFLDFAGNVSIIFHSDTQEIVQIEMCDDEAETEFLYCEREFEDEYIARMRDLQGKEYAEKLRNQITGITHITNELKERYV